MHGLRWLWGLGFLLLCVSALPAQVIYVNNVIGDDRNDGTSPDNEGPGVGPVATVQRAFELARAGSTIELAATGEPYTTPFFNRRPVSGVSGHPIILEGNGVELRGWRAVPHDAWQYVGKGTYRMQPLRKGFYALRVDGKVADRVAYEIANGTPQLEPLQWAVHQGYIYLRLPEGKYIDQITVEIPGADVGLNLHNARHVVVRNLTITGFRLDGVHVHGRSEGVVLENITCRHNGRSGIALGNAASATLRRCQLEGNGEAELYVYGTAKAELVECKLLGGARYLVDARGGQARLKNCVLGSYQLDRFRQRGGRVIVDQQ